MGKLRPAGYIFLTWIGDHPPRHVHVIKDGCQVLKFDLERWKVIEGKITKRIFKILTELRKEGRL